MPEPGTLERFQEIVKSHRRETEEPLKPDVCDVCFLIYAYEDLLKECREWRKSAKMLYWNER